MKKVERKKSGFWQTVPYALIAAVLAAIVVLAVNI